MVQRIVQRRCVVFVLALAAGPLSAIDRQDTRMLFEPAVSAEHVAFSYAGDLWVAGRDGGQARRLTSAPGDERRPRFSPDGRWIAFTGEYDGNVDVYLVPTEGGEPRRLTTHPSVDDALGFTPDGKAVLFATPRSVYSGRHRHLYTVPLEGGMPTRLPIPHAFKAAFSSDGGTLAYQPQRDAFAQWKHYRGGTTARLWLYSPANQAVVEVPQPPGRANDTDPAWLGGKLYFRSDRDGEFNLYSYDPATRAVTALTHHTDFPVLWVSAGGGKVVYDQAGALHLYDPGTGTSRRLTIGVAADLPETRPRFVEVGADAVRSANLSPSGARAVFELRGEIVTLPAEKGDARNLTATPGAHERSPVWSPDGTQVAYFSDESGEYEIVVAPQDGKGDKKRYAPGGAGFYERLRFSPDGKKLSYHDNSRTIRVLDLASGSVTRVTSERLYGPVDTLFHAWSPDSRWIAYTRVTQTYFQEVWLYSLADGQSHALTDGLADVSEPVWDAGGKYLYFAAATDAGPVRDWFSQASSASRSQNALYVAVLARATASPLAAQSDEETPKVEEPKAATPPAKPATETKTAGPAPVVIDLDGLAQRILALPLPAGRYFNLEPGPENQLYYLKSDLGANLQGVPAASLRRYDLAEREEKTLKDAADAFVLSHDKKKLLVTAGGSWQLVDAGPPVEGGKGGLAPAKVQVKIDPRAEWRQIYDEAWRINRDYFYDPGMHGADWPALRSKYAQFLPHLTSRQDLNRLLQWLFSELAVGHHNVGGGDTVANAKRIPGGLLGADYEVADGHYRFAKVFGGLNWNPELRAPLTEPGVDVRAGEFLLAVDGVPLRAPEELYARFENKAGKTVELTVGPDASGKGARQVKVVPIEDERGLRHRDWVEGNLAKVTAATGGQVAYVYVPDTADGGFEYFRRYFYPQANRAAIIIDERHNAGGLVADYVIDLLRRPAPFAHWAMRYGGDLETPLAAIAGPKVMIIDETAGSGGDLLPWMFRYFKLGPLVGKRTWGGLVGILGFPTLLDGGFVSAPNLGFWTEDGFRVENEGVPADVEVEQWPALVAQGRDPQLEKAIELALAELAKNPPKQLVRPPFPIRAAWPQRE
ncbi:MAG: PDZ domain-containing protein [Thermoanaerobaculia bacterium]|nr:PDZ domain-containing protein [Thermoanaerobaculia bacterium]